MIAAEQHGWVAPFASQLAALLTHRHTRARWEAAHSLALIAATAPEAIGPLLEKFSMILSSDKSTIVLDYSVDAVGIYAGSGEPAARAAYPIHLSSLTVWDGNHAGHALAGLAQTALSVPGLRAEICTAVQGYLDDSRGVVRKAAKDLLKVCK